MASLLDFEGKLYELSPRQFALLQSLHRLHHEFAEHTYSVSKVGITFEGQRGLNRTLETLEQLEFIEVEHVPGSGISPKTATVWLTDKGRALFR